MKTAARLFAMTSITALYLLLPRASAAEVDAAATDAGGASAEGGPSVPVACGGALCDTTNDATCAVARGVVGGATGGGTTSSGSEPAPSGYGALLLLASALALVVARRRGRRVGPPPRAALAMPFVTFATFAALAAEERTARAEEPAASEVVVTVRETPPPSRVLAVEWNPLPLAVGKLSANVVIAPFDHHALVVSPFYAWVTTAPVYVFDETSIVTGQAAAQLPEQKFQGYGAELGYRWYSGGGGLRGVFVGPSLILGAFEVKAQNGDKTDFLDVGIAADVGYQVLVGDRVALSLGAGAQYLTTSKSIPAQQFPARIYANRGVLPRMLLSMGWAF